MTIAAVKAAHELDALGEKFQELKHQLSNAFDEQDLFSFFQAVCEQIVPTLLSHPHLETCRKAWVQEKEEYAKKYQQYEKQTIAEVKTSFTLLWDRYSKVKHRDPIFTELFESIERVLEGQENEEPYVTPHAYEIAHDRLKELCIKLYERGYDEVVKDVIEVQTETVGRFMPVKFLLAPSLERLRALSKVWDWNEPAIWGIWEYLYAACWAWKTPYKFFKRKSLHFDRPVKCRHSLRLLELYDTWWEIQNIREPKPKKPKNDEEPPKVPFFTVERFSKYLNRIIQQIISTPVALCHDNKDNVPYALELLLSGDELLLGIQQSKEGITIWRVLQRFYDESQPWQFIKRLLSSEDDSSVSISEGCNQSVARLIARAGLQGILKKIFIKKSAMNSCILSYRKVLLHDFKELDLNELNSKLSNLPLHYK